MHMYLFYVPVDCHGVSSNAPIISTPALVKEIKQNINVVPYNRIPSNLTSTLWGIRATCSVVLIEQVIKTRSGRYCKPFF